MTRRRSLATLLCLLGLAGDAAAQTVTDERVWFLVTIQQNSPSSSPWRGTVEMLVRSREGLRSVDSLAVRPTISYVLSPRVTVGGGYLIGPSFPAAGGTLLEQRAFGQMAVAARAGGATLSFRTRMEARFLEGNSGVAGRVRQLARVSHPIRRGSRVSVVAYDEVMVHVNDTSRAARGIDQNRAFAGISVSAAHLRVEAGYLNQFSPGHRGAADRRNHVLSTALAVSWR